MKFFSLNTFLNFFFISLCSISFGQFEIKDSILFETDAISNLKTNNFGDVLLILNEKELVKIDAKKNKKRLQLNKIVTSIDTNLSLKTGLIYNYQELQILDDNLNPIQDKINFNQHQIFPSTVSISDSQLLWYFDPIEQRLIQWNYQLKTEISRSNILFFKDNDTTIECIHQVNNQLFLKSQNWIYEFDIFGNSKSTIQLKKHDKYSFSGDYIYLTSGNELTEINLKNNQISTSDNFFNVKDFTMKDDQLFVIKNKGLYIYTRIK